MTIHAAPVLSIHVQCRSLPAVKPFSRAAGPRLSLAAHHTLTVSGAGLLPVLRRILFPAAEAAVRQRMSWLSWAEGASPSPCALPAGSEVPRPVHAPYGPALLSQRHRFLLCPRFLRAVAAQAHQPMARAVQYQMASAWRSVMSAPRPLRGLPCR